jgi:asparagine synthase (glutamine-hydrolysing)
MCGITGFVSFEKQLSGEDRPIVEKMNATLHHRGPDENDVMIFDNVAFGFSRLSIIGLHDGMQPILNEDGSLVLICNGEVFNYIEIKQELISRGHVFKTHSDVEVIIHLYEEHGMQLLDHLNGQFAFALYDKMRKRLFCARDQMGICPFYYTMFDNTFIFGSEIKAILAHPYVRREVDLTGLDQVFSFPGLISPRTMFKNIHSLENGHYLQVDDGGRIQNIEYWDLIYPEGDIVMNGRSEASYVDELEGLFEQSIKLRLRADVPMGLYLSGGLDSSMITMKVSQLQPGIVSEAFSIDFVESEISETKYQKLIASKSNAKLHRKTFYFDDISGRLKQAIYHCECPLKETYNTASLSLSASTRARGIKVILSGEGSDELFAGYVGYRFDKMRAMNLVQNPLTAKEKQLREQVWGDSSMFYETNFVELEQTKRSLYSSAVNAIFEEINCLNHPVVNKQRLQNRSALSKRSYIDYKVRLVDHLVSDHGDRMALANAVEARYPFLDKNFIHFSTQIPADLKLNEFTEKYILKKLAARFVPSEVINREKFGFVAPGSPYLLQHKVEYVHDLLSYDLIKKQGFFDPGRIEQLKKIYSKPGFSVNYPFESDLLIPVITFGILLDTFFRR